MMKSVAQAAPVPAATLQVPDILNGSMTMGASGPNRWRTGIEAALLFGQSDAYLATDCRAEHVRPEGPLIGHRFCEASVIAATDGDYMIRAGAGIWHPFRRRASDALHYDPFQRGATVTAPIVPAEPVDFDALYNALSSGETAPVFMQVAYEFEGTAYRIICPCRYINYAPPGAEPYIQPISGYVLFRKGGRYHQGYIVAYVDRIGIRNCEVVLRAPTSVVDLKAGVGGKSVSILRALLRPLRRVLMTDEFHQVIRLDAEVGFFRY